MDKNRDVETRLRQDDDGEEALIKFNNLGCATDLITKGSSLSVRVLLSGSDIIRILEGMKEAELKRIDPNSQTIEYIEALTSRTWPHDEDQGGLSYTFIIDMPVGGSGVINLKPVFDDFKYSSTEDENII